MRCQHATPRQTIQKNTTKKAFPTGAKTMKMSSLGAPTTLPGTPNNAFGGDGTQGSSRKRKFELSSPGVTPARSPLEAPKGTHKATKTVKEDTGKTIKVRNMQKPDF